MRTRDCRASLAVATGSTVKVVTRLEVSSDSCNTRPGSGSETRILYDRERPPAETVKVVTVPAPTVRPPSRIAKPSPASSGTSRPSSTVMVTVSPGRATPAVPRSTSPTTSAVRM